MQKRRYTFTEQGYAAHAVALHKRRGKGGTYSHLTPEQKKAYHRRAAARQYQRDRAKRLEWIEHMQAGLAAPAKDL